MSLLLLAVVISSFYCQDYKLLGLVVFTLGLLGDLIMGTGLGLSSFTLLTASLVIYLYRRKFSSNNLFFQLILVGLITIIYNLIWHHVFAWQSLTVPLLVTLLIFLFLHKLGHRTSDLEWEVE